MYGERQSEIVKAAQKALSPWRVGFENVTWNREAKNVAEVQCTFSVPSSFAAIQIGVVGITISAFNPDWSRAPNLVSMFQSAVDAVQDGASQGFQSQLTTLSFHVKPGPKPFREIVGRFVNQEALAVKDASMFGVSVYTPDYSFVVDGSAIVHGGAFIKLIRSFGTEKRFEEMAKIIYQDEAGVLSRLDLKLS